MKKFVPLLLIPLMMFGLLGAPQEALADGASCDKHNPGSTTCTLNSDDSPPSRPEGNQPGRNSGRPSLPLCSTMGEGAAVERSKPGPEMPGNWVRVACTDATGTSARWLNMAIELRSAEQIARSLLAQVDLEPIDIGIAPDGVVMHLVGLPVWFWVKNPDRTSWGPATITAGGMSLTAEAESVVWKTGDGTTVRCGKGTAWRPGMPVDSPTCDHTYTERGEYELSATSHWVARWHGYGQSGTIPFTMTRERTVRVGEIQVVVTRGGR